MWIKIANGQLLGRFLILRITILRNIQKTLAEWTGLEPATTGVTGRYSNQLNYHSAWNDFRKCLELLLDNCQASSNLPALQQVANSGNLASPRGFEPL